MTTAPPQSADSGDELSQLRERIVRMRADAAMPRDEIAALERQLATLIAERLPAAIAGLPLAELPGMAAPVAAIPLRELTAVAAEDLRRQQPGERLVVLDDEGLPLGVVEDDLEIDLSDLPPDQFAGAFEPLAQPFAHEQVSESTEPVSVSGRALNIWIEGWDANDPLIVGRAYELRCSIGAPRDTLPIKASFPALEYVEQQEIEVFAISSNAVLRQTDRMILRVARSGVQESEALSVSIEPLRERVTLTIVLARRSLVFQTVRITLGSPGGLQIQTRGETIDSALQHEPPETSGMTFANILVSEVDARGYELTFVSNDLPAWQTTIPAGRVAEVLDRMRETLIKTAMYMVDGEYAYRRADTVIPDDAYRANLRELARAGRYLFEMLFGSSDSELVQRLRREPGLRLRVIAERFIFPWGLIYSGDIYSPNPEDFWGVRHIIDQPMSFAALETGVVRSTLPAEALARIGFAADRMLDEQLGMPVIARMQERLAAFGVETEDASADQLARMLAGVDDAPSLVAVYCTARGGDAPALLIGDQSLSIRGLTLTYTSRTYGGPLVLLNIVESAELSPEYAAFADLVSFLARRGAYGLVGNLFALPVPFAAEFGIELLRRFLNGMPLGVALREVRREYLFKRNNVLGLLYELYADADAVVVRESA